MITPLAGLASGFDWNTFVDTIMDLERAPINRLNIEKNTNQIRNNALLTLNTNLTGLKSAVDALEEPGAFTSRSTAVSGASSGWSASASAGAVVRPHTFDFLQSATTASLAGANDIGVQIAATSDVSGVSLASLGTSVYPSAGVFTVNGEQVTVDLGESLQDLFDRISTATSGAVTAAYDPATDKINLTGTGPIILGAANDTSNFLAVTRLGNNGTAAISSSATLGTVNANATLDSARLSTAITAVDGNGDGNFSLNGVSIAYNTGTDSLSAILTRINDSSAGVTAAFDSISDRVVLTNDVTGDLGISVSEASGGLLGALGLTSGTTFNSGDNARFTVNGGPELTVTTNSLSETEHGITGLVVNADSIGSSTITVNSNTDGMRDRVDQFISAYNTVQRFIDAESKVTSANGEVTTSTLSSNREVQSWASTLRRAVFSAVPGLDSGLARLEHLGIDFVSGTSELAVLDSDKLDEALTHNSDKVAAFFQQASTGFSANLNTLLDGYLGVNGGNGLLANQRELLTKTNKSLDQQISDIERRLVQRRTLLESGFIAMERAQSELKLMQDQLSNAFPSASASSNK